MAVLSAGWRRGPRTVTGLPDLVGELTAGAYGVGVGPQHPQAVAQTLCSITRTLTRLTRSRGADWGANDARYWATPGHSQPP